jgi:2TM domain
MEMTDQQLPSVDQDRRDRAIARLKKRRDFGAHLFVFLVVNGFLIGVWAFTGAGFFWPVFPMFLWGIGLVLNVWDVYWRRPVSEDQVRREMERMR